MSDTEILMNLQQQVGHQTGLLEGFIESQKSLNSSNSAQHQILFDKTDWLKTRVVVLSVLAGAGGGAAGTFISKFF